MTSAEPSDASSAPDRELPAWRILLRRALPVLLAGLVIYVLAPVLLRVFAAWPRLSSLTPGWVVLGLIAEAASIACTTLLKRIALRTKAVFAVLTSGLVGNAVTNVSPGADVTGAAVELSMLVSAGVDVSAAAGGLTATGLLQTGTLLALPVLALPAIVAGVRISRGLEHLAYLGLGMFVLYTAALLVMAEADAPLRLVGRLAQGLHNHLLRWRAPVTNLPARLVEQRNATRAAVGEKWQQALGYAIARIGFDFLCLFAMLCATRVRPQPALVLIAYAATTVLALLPVTPGGLGLVEGSLTGLLVLAGVPASNAVLATLAYRMASYWLPTISGPVAYVAFTRRYHLGRLRRGESGRVRASSQHSGLTALVPEGRKPYLAARGSVIAGKEVAMDKPQNLAVFVALYEHLDFARVDLDTVERLHDEDLVGSFDAAIIDKAGGKPHIIKRMDRPRLRVIPEELGFGPLSRKELKEAAAELDTHEAALIVIGEPSVDAAIDKALTNAAKTVKHVVDPTTDELSRVMQEAIGS